MNRFVQDPIANTYWEGCVRGELWIQRCRPCGRAQFYPRAACTACLARDPDWIQASGEGIVYAITRVDRPPELGTSGGEFLAIVELEEGPRMLTHIVGAGESLPDIGARVSVRFEPLDGDDVRYPVFTIDRNGT